MSINVVSIVFHCFSPINLCSRFFAFFFSRSPFWTTRRSAGASEPPTTRAPPGRSVRSAEFGSGLVDLLVDLQRVEGRIELLRGRMTFG